MFVCVNTTRLSPHRGQLQRFRRKGYALCVFTSTVGSEVDDLRY
jgi:hypothetical protein